MNVFGWSDADDRISDPVESFGEVSLVASFHLVASARPGSLTAASETLVLIASDRDAVMCSNCDGKSQIIGEIASGYRRQPNPPMQGKGRGERPYAIAFARDLIEFLKREISRRRYEDVVILANDDIRHELRLVASDNLSRLFYSHPTGMSAPRFSSHLKKPVQPRSVGCEPKRKSNT